MFVVGVSPYNLTNSRTRDLRVVELAASSWLTLRSGEAIGVAVLTGEAVAMAYGQGGM